MISPATFTTGISKKDSSESATFWWKHSISITRADNCLPPVERRRHDCLRRPTTSRFWNSAGPVFHHPGDQRHIRFLKGADLLIHDAQYTSDEYQTKLGWGHSPINYAIDVAISAGVSQLALFHHDPTHDDARDQALEDGAKQQRVESGSKLDVFAAAEGMEFEIAGKGSAITYRAVLRLDRRPITGGRASCGQRSDVRYRGDRAGLERRWSHSDGNSGWEECSQPRACLLTGSRHHQLPARGWSGRQLYPATAQSAERSGSSDHSA